MCGLTGYKERTLRRRLHDNGIFVRDKYADISDRDLDEAVFNVLQKNPTIGTFDYWIYTFSRPVIF